MMKSLYLNGDNDNAEEKQLPLPASDVVVPDATGDPGDEDDDDDDDDSDDEDDTN
jgi:hypothetical protein